MCGFVFLFFCCSGFCISFVGEAFGGVIDLVLRFFYFFLFLRVIWCCVFSLLVQCFHHVNKESWN